MNHFQQNPLKGVVRNRHEAVDNDMQYSRSVPKVGDGHRKKKDSARKREQERQARYDRKVKGKSYNELQSKWDEMYSRLVKYKDYHGHCLVPNRYKADPSLGAWVSTQRRQYKILIAKGSASTPMTPERANKLVSVGFVWATKDPRHVPWEVRFQELLEYKKKYGDCLVPVGFKENSQLSNWVSTQRQEYKQLSDGRPSRLDHEKVRILEAVGFVWEALRGSAARRKIVKKKKEETSENQKQKQNQTPSDPSTMFHSSMPNPMFGPAVPFQPPYPTPMFPIRPPMPFQQAPSFPPENRAMPNATKSRNPPYIPNSGFYGPHPYSNFPPFNGAAGYFAGPAQDPGFHYPPTSRRRSGRGSRRSRKKRGETEELSSSDEESGSSSSLASEENENGHSWSNESRKRTKKAKRTKLSHENGQQPEFASHLNIQATPRPSFRKMSKSDVQNSGDTAKDQDIKGGGEGNVMEGPLPQVTSGCISSLMQLNGRGLRERPTFPLNNIHREGLEIGARRQSSIKIDGDSDVFADAEEDNICADPNFI